MRLNWFSPLPPAHSEVANHTARLLPALCQRAEVVLWTDQPRWSEELERHAPVRRFQPGQLPWAELNREGVSCYNVGNDPHFHTAIWEVSRCRPGIVILHDTHLQHLFAAALQRGGVEDYRAEMAKYYGLAGTVSVNAYLAGHRSLLDLAESFPLTGLAVENALGVVVHSRAAFEKLSRLGRCAVIHAPLPYLPDPPGKRAAWPTANADPCRLIVFGFIGPNRRLEAVLHALANFPAKDAFRLEIYGTLDAENQVRALIRSLNLSNQVVVRGYVPERQLDDALSNSHFAFNLRYPSMGEASASQLRIWSHSLPSAVSRVGWYADQPADTVLFVRPDHEAEDLHAALQGLLRNSEDLLRIGASGRKHLEQNHTPAAYAESLLLLASQIGELRSRWLATQMTKRAAAALSPWSFPGPLVASFGRIAGEVYRLTPAA